MKHKEKPNMDSEDKINSLKTENQLLKQRNNEVDGHTSDYNIQLEKAFDANPDPMNINRLSDGKFVLVNKGFTDLFGFSRDEALGKTTIELQIWTDPKERERFSAIIRENGSIEGYDVVFRRKDGTLFSGRISAVKIDIDGEECIINVSRDITEQKKILEKLNQEQFLFNALMDNLSDAVYFKDRQSRFLRISRSNISKFGISNTSEAIGKTDFDFFTEEHARQAFNDEQQIIATGIPISVEERETNRDRPDTWASTVKMPLRDNAGDIVGTFGISRDITGKKRSEFEKQVIYEITRGLAYTNNLDEYLKHVHGSLSKIVYAENCFIALFDKNTGLFSFPFFIDKYDSRPEPASLEKSCTAYVYRSGRPLLLTDEFFKFLAENHEVELIGTESPSWLGVPLRIPAGIIGVLVLQHYETENIFTPEDVDFLISVCSQIASAIERVRSEEEIIRINDQLRNLIEEKDKFLSIIAHDLRGPIGAFRDTTRLIVEDWDTIGMEQIKYLIKLLKEDSASVYTLLENLLQWARFRRGLMRFNPVALSVREKASEWIEPLAESALKKNITIENEISEDLNIVADPDMLSAVFRNLVSNSIKFTPHLGRITLKSKVLSDKIEITVSDTGIGMDADLIKKLFILSEKPNRPGTDGEPSSGLGLHLCREFVEKHSGTISVSSEPGKGSSFIISLPLIVS